MLDQMIGLFAFFYVGEYFFIALSILLF